MGMLSVTTSEIFEALTIACDEGQLRAIKGLLTKNHDTISDLLSRSLSPEAVQYVARYGSAGNPTVLLTFINILERDIEKFIFDQKSPQETRVSLEETLKNALQNQQVSAELLETVFQYIELFCAKYPPQKIPDWELEKEGQSSADMDPFFDDYGIGELSLGKQNREVQEKEITTLRQCMEAIKHWVNNLRLVACLNQMPTEIRRLRLAKKQNIIDTLAHIMVYLRQITDYSDTYAPYHELCKPGQPFGIDKNDFDCKQLICSWEGLHGELKKLKNSENI